MIRELGRSIGETVMETVGRAASRIQERRPLPADVLESEEAFLVVFDAPGATSSDLQVRFEDNTVEVRIDRFREFHEGFEMMLPGRGLSLDGSVTLPPEAKVDADEATATLRQNGSLEIEIPKSEGAREMVVTEEATVTDEVAVESDATADTGEDDTED
jgi:HSP20 family protein